MNNTELGDIYYGIIKSEDEEGDPIHGEIVKLDKLEGTIWIDKE